MSNIIQANDHVDFSKNKKQTNKKKTLHKKQGF